MRNAVEDDFPTQTVLAVREGPDHRLRSFTILYLGDLRKFKWTLQMSVLLFSFKSLKIILFYFLFMAVLGLCCYVRAFSGCGEQGTTLGCSAWDSHWCGFSCGAQALYTGFSSWPLGLSSCGSLAQWLWSMGLIVPLHVVSSWIRDQTRVPCTGRWTLNHWTIREAQMYISQSG